MRLHIRDRKGAPWFSRCGGEAYNNKVRACMDNPDLSPAARALLEGLLRDGLDGLSVVEEAGTVKLVCRREKVRLTIQIEHPHRTTTAASINTLAARLDVAQKPDQQCPADASAPSDVVLSPKLSLEARLKARAALGAGASPERVRSKAHFIELWGNARPPREA